MTHNTTLRPEGISVIIHTRNSAEDIGRALSSVHWADECIVVDMMSEDTTREIAISHEARILDCHPHPRVDEVRNQFLDCPEFSWTLVLDSDETVPDDADHLIQSLIEKAGQDIDGYELPRYNRIAGEIVRGSGWYPDHSLRLFRTGHVSWGKGHHELPSLKSGDHSRQVQLDPKNGLHIHHRNYENLTEVIQKQLEYALTDCYEKDQETFDFRTHVEDAYLTFSNRHDFDTDGDLSTALSTVMAWDKIIRGLIEWDKLGRVHPLHDRFSLPIQIFRPELHVMPGKVLIDESTCRKFMEAERWRDEVENTLYYRTIKSLTDRFPGVMRRMSSFSRSCVGLFQK